MNCLVNGDIFNWTINVGNGSIIPVTGVTTTVTLPAGVTYAANTATKGTYNSGTGVWAVGSLAVGASATLVITVEVTNATLQPFTASAIVAGNEFEEYLLNNVASDVKGGACDDGCAGGFDCVDNIASCTCGRISLNTGACSATSTMDYRIVEESEVNSTVVLDSLTGDYSVTVIDYNLPWSFDWEVWCCCGEICSGPFTSCTISGNSPFVVTEVLGYSEYTALLTQAGTDDPVVTVLKSDIDPIVWERASTGVYTGTLVGAFTDEKTVTFSSYGGGTADGLLIDKFYRVSDDVVHLTVIDNSNVVADADTDGPISIMIRIYN